MRILFSLLCVFLHFLTGLFALLYIQSLSSIFDLPFSFFVALSFIPLVNQTTTFLGISSFYGRRGRYRILIYKLLVTITSLLERPEISVTDKSKALAHASDAYEFLEISNVAEHEDYQLYRF